MPARFGPVSVSATSAALARARGDNPIAVSGIQAEVAGPLPVSLALRLPSTLLEELARLGLRRVHDLLHLPRGPLARRFGQDQPDRLDAVAGQRSSPIRPAIPPPELTVVRDLLEPVITRAGIETVLDRLLEAFCAELQQAGLGVRQLVLSAWRVDGLVQEVPIGTGLAVREPAHLRRLFAERLERLEPGLGFERMTLEARAAEPMATGFQTGLRVGARTDAATAVALAQLLDRLGQRVQVQRVMAVASHWPERAVAARDPHGVAPAMPAGWGKRPSPVLLLRRPLPLEAVALLPAEAEGILRFGGAGGDRAARADPGRHGSPLSAPATGAGAPFLPLAQPRAR